MWLMVAGIGILGEMYFFMMQRSALEVCRAAHLPVEARFLMVPRYYRLTWLFIIGKWTAIVALFLNGRWPLASGLLASIRK